MLSFDFLRVTIESEVKRFLFLIYGIGSNDQRVIAAA